MAPTHSILGTLQFCINGQWSELTLLEQVYAHDHADAVQRVFARHESLAREVDAYALVRWYSTPLVGEL